jgi:hypothetical protein
VYTFLGHSVYTRINDGWSAALHRKEIKSYIAKGRKTEIGTLA